MKDKPSILVVDDDPNISRLEQLYLEKENYEVRIADRGDTAVEEFRRMPPDLILLDVMLPGMDGYQVLRAVRKSGNIPVIMVTARGETFDKVLCLELGADDYITKPFDGKELTARIKAVLRRAQGSDEEKNTDVTDGQHLRIRRAVRREKDRDAAEGAGSAVLPGFPSEPGVHAGAAAVPGMGIRFLRGQPDGGRAHQAAAGKAAGERKVRMVAVHSAGRGI